jgi:hypothetical protein
MGNKISSFTQKTTITKFRTIERNYLDGIRKKHNFDIENIYLTLIMKLIYSQAKNNLKQEPRVYEGALCSNPIAIMQGIPFIIPSTFDYISGFKVSNTNTEPCVINVSWDTIVIETFVIDGNTTKEIHIPKLYIFMVSTNDWTIDVDAPNVSIQCKCGMMDNKVLTLYTSYIKTYLSTTMNRFEFVNGIIRLQEPTQPSGTIIRKHFSA